MKQFKIKTFYDDCGGEYFMLYERFLWVFWDRHSCHETLEAAERQCNATKAQRTLQNRRTRTIKYM